MNTIREIQSLNKRELENGISSEGSWHADYRDTAYIYIGGLPFDLSEGDIITIFSQFGEPVYTKLIRDKESGKSKGFAFLKYEDQRSTDLAVDNLGGVKIMGRILKADHTRYKRKDDEAIEDYPDVVGVPVQHKGEDMKRGGGGKREQNENSEEERPRRQILKEEHELAELIKNHDDDDPMKNYLIEEKEEELKLALNKLKRSKKRDQNPRDAENRRHRHRHRRREYH